MKWLVIALVSLQPRPSAAEGVRLPPTSFHLLVLGPLSFVAAQNGVAPMRLSPGISAAAFGKPSRTPLGNASAAGAAAPSVGTVTSLVSLEDQGEKILRPNVPGESASAAGSAAFDGQIETPISANAGLPVSDPATPRDPGPPSGPEFHRIVIALYARSTLSNAQRESLSSLVAAAVNRRDVTLLAQLALLAGPVRDPQTYGMLHNALRALKIKYMLHTDKGDEFQVGLDAERALETLARHSHQPLEDARDKEGRLTGGRAWIVGQLLSRHDRDYPARLP